MVLAKWPDSVRPTEHNLDYPMLNRPIGRSSSVEAIAGTTTRPHLATDDETIRLTPCCEEPPPGIVDSDSL